jgi:hypothetical protein
MKMMRIMLWLCELRILQVVPRRMLPLMLSPTVVRTLLLVEIGAVSG